MTLKFEMGGFDELGRDFEDVSEALGALERNAMTATFDPNDLASVESEIRRLHRVFDARVARYRSNPFIADLAAQVKAQYAERIREYAAQRRRDDPQQGAAALDAGRERPALTLESPEGGSAE